MNQVEIDATIRVSVWLEENKNYLMPCQFLKVQEENSFYFIKVEVLDPRNLIQSHDIGKKFFFGHPGKMIGYGILNELIL